jgi:BASS family bile acid:Na+ symporter
MRYLPGEGTDWLVFVESAMLCFICPTATAAAVVTRKLGGDVAGITTYTILINLVTALIVPLIVPMIRPVDGMNFWLAFSMIMAKIFPLLIMPCLLAWMVRYMAPKLHRILISYPDLPFYLWSVGLALAVAVTTRSIFNSRLGLVTLLLISLISLLCCIIQFALGRYVGGMYKPRRQADREINPEVEKRGKALRKVTAGQSLGQKNTIFAIWMAYTFMTPETSIVGGLYSIWHNIYNSWQMYRSGRADA